MAKVSITYMAVTYLIVFGGIKYIGRIASKIVPIMCLFYIVAGIFIILKNFSNIGHSMMLIISSAFNGIATTEGFTGVAVSQVIRMGVARVVFSSEAGWGISPIITLQLKQIIVLSKESGARLKYL